MAGCLEAAGRYVSGWPAGILAKVGSCATKVGTVRASLAPEGMVVEMFTDREMKPPYRRVGNT